MVGWIENPYTVLNLTSIEQETMRRLKRSVVHFPGFEGLDAKAHLKRYKWSARRSGKTYGLHVQVGDLVEDRDTQKFGVQSTGPNWSVSSTFHLLDGHNRFRSLAEDPPVKRLLRGLVAAWGGLLQGGLFQYFRISWRFGLFALYPVLIALLGLGTVGAVALLPAWFDLSALHFAWSVSLALALFLLVLVPIFQRLYILTLFDGIHETVMLAKLVDSSMHENLARCQQALAAILEEPADEYLMTTHSRGGTIAILVLGEMLKRNPALLAGKQFSLITLGGSGLHVALLNSAVALRDHYRTILSCPDVFWIDYQCLADPINFYHSRPARDLGLTGVREPYLVRIRVKDMVSRKSYRKMRFDFLRIHRQFVLGSDNRTRFDFTLLTSGPFAAKDFLQFPATGVPLDEKGAIKSL